MKPFRLFALTAVVVAVFVTTTRAASVLEQGWAKDEYWYTANPGTARFINNVTNGAGFITAYLATNYTTAPDDTIFQPRFEGSSRSNEAGDNYTERVSGLFYPPATDNYVFFVNGDDDSDLFISTDSTPSNAVLVAQETGWSNPWQWTSANGGSASTKCSATWTDLNNGKPWASGIHLIQGQPYYMALIHHEGGGGDNCEATFMTVSEYNASGMTGPALGTYSRLTGNLISSYAPRCFSMSFLQQPGTVTVPVGGVATLAAPAATDSTSAIGDNLDPRNEWTNYVFYQWTRNAIPIPGAVSSSYSFGPVSPQDGLQQFACAIRALGYVDSGGNAIWATSSVANVVVTGGAVYEPGFSLHQFYGSNPGRIAVENNVGGTPTWSMASTAFEVNNTGGDIADNFTDQLVGFFVPPTTGNYVFFCNADDDTDLFLSTDSSSSGRRLIAQEVAWSTGPLQWGSTTSNPNQVRSDTFIDPITGTTPYSGGIPLVAGQKYFMQCVHHQGGGGTYSCITYEMTTDLNYPNAPASGSLSTIRGNQVGTYVPQCTYVTFTNQPQSVTANNFSSATFTAGGTTDSTVPIGGEDDWRQYFNNLLQFQWYKNGALVASGTNSALTLPNVLPGDDGTTVYCTMRALGYGDSSGNRLWATSSVATLTVVSVPYAAGLSVPDRRELYVYFSTNMDAATAMDASHYTINHGVTVTNVSFAPGLATNGPQSVVRLYVQPALGIFSDFSLSISNVLGTSGGGLLPILPNPTVLPFQITYRNLGYLYLSPLPGAQYVSAQINLVLVRFSSISPGALNNLSSCITVTGSSSGAHAGSTHIAGDGRTVIFQMSGTFFEDELVTVALNPQVASGSSPDPYQYQFVIGGHLPDPPIITARGDNPPYQSKEKAFDGDPSTKWLDYIVPNGTNNYSWIQYLYPDNGTVVAGQYAITSATDAPERDPADWNFYGVDASTNLVLLDRQTNQVFSTRGQTITYTLSSPMAFRGYRLEITRVNNPATATAVQLAELQFTERQGSLLRQYWLGISGNAVSDLTNNANFPASPSGSGQIATFEAPVNWALNYGQRVRGFITAPASGTYVFWISSDDDSELFLSTDVTPANKKLVASVTGWTNPREWSKYSSQQSAGINLTAGQQYYVEALHKQGAGGDNLAVGWALPGQSTASPSQIIPSGVLSPWLGGPVATPEARVKRPVLAGDPGQPVRSFATILSNNVSIPSDFPQVNVSVRRNPALDYIWLENIGQNGQTYKMILDTWGNPVFYQRGGARDFKPQKNGTITWAGFTAVDNNFNYLRTYGTANGYGTDDHELVVMKDGSYFLIGGATESVDMSRYITGGNPNASVLDNVVQQFTAADELIFQWRAWDYMNVLSQQQFIDDTSASFDFPHMNSIDVDDDGNILLSSRSSSECTKIDRDTGDVIWRLGGSSSTLTFINDPLNGPRQQHGFRALGGGHYILFDDGNLHNPSVSRAVEYVVDPVAKTATLVWQFRDTPDKYAYYMGNVQRLTNGNTHINWVLAAYPHAVEVDTNGVKQLEMSLTPGQDLYRSWRAPWNGVLPAPYLIAESYPDNVTLIFNKFGDTNVSYYRIYGGTTPHPTTLLASTPYTLARLSNLQNNQQYYFDVTAVSGNGTESPYSNEETVMVNLVQPGQNMLVNGDFSSDTNGWIFATNNTGAGTFSVVTGACLIHITSPGTVSTDIQLRQSGLKLIQGKKYYLEFDGSAVGSTHIIEAKLGQDQSPFGIYYAVSPALTPARQHFIYSFTMTNATDLNSRLMFNMGGLARDVVLDNVTVYMAYPTQVTVTLATLPAGLTVAVDGTNYITPASVICATNSSHILSAPTAQLSADGHTRYPFVSWSDNGFQTHAITTSLFDANYSATFTTQYLLDTAVAPTNAGTISELPNGPWYAPNTSVSLTANPNPGFQFASWSGVDSQSNNTAQAVMHGYHSVTASFQLVQPIVIDTSSLTRLPDGRIQFAITAGPGVTQVTVWATTLLSAPNWQQLGTVPLTGGRGLFTESSPSATPTRFYRATAP
jgi:hypothetical protein